MRHGDGQREEKTRAVVASNEVLDDLQSMADARFLEEL